MKDSLSFKQAEVFFFCVFLGGALKNWIFPYLTTIDAAVDVGEVRGNQEDHAYWHTENS